MAKANNAGRATGTAKKFTRRPSKARAGRKPAVPGKSASTTQSRKPSRGGAVAKATKRAATGAAKPSPRAVSSASSGGTGARKATRARSSTGAVRITAIDPARSGANWKVRLSDGRAVTVPSDAAQAARLKVGAAWSASTAARVESAALDLATFQNAMRILASGARLGYDALVQRLGGDARARRAVADLVRSGWLD